jgi:hypothetical protein
MWLPKDERLLLSGLYHNVQDGEDLAFEVQDLATCFKHGYRKQKIPEYRDANGPQHGIKSEDSAYMEAYFENDERVRSAIRRLAGRGLITHVDHQHVRNVVVIGPTLAGHDLGGQYSKLFSRTGLWFREYKDHWLWLLVAFIGGGFVGGIVSNLADRLLQNEQ